MPSALLSMFVLLGCWQLQEESRKRRLWEMQDHEEYCLAARDAVIRQDLVALQRAGFELSQPDLVPDIPEPARAHLDAVRASAKTLSEAATLPAGAATLLEVTSHCGACHQLLQARISERLDPNPSALEDLWTAVLFQSDERWTLGVTELKETPTSAVLRSASGWDERRRAMVGWLLDGAR